MFDAQRTKRPENDKSPAEPTQKSSRVEQRTRHTGDLTRIPLYTQLAWGTQPPPWLHPPVQRQVAHEEELLQARDEPLTQRKENTTGLPDTLKAGVEDLSGLSMDDVQVHYSSDKPAQLQALAYTQGTEIHVGPGQEQHLAHEAWHVVQQKQGRVKPTSQAQSVAINDDEGLEQEADMMSTKVNTTQSIPNIQAQPGGAFQRKAIIQRKLDFDNATNYLDPQQNLAINNQVYIGVINEAETIPQKISVKEDSTLTTPAKYTPAYLERAGSIFVSPRDAQHERDTRDAAFNNRLSQVAHETRHALDDLRRDVRDVRTSDDSKIHSEFRAFATEAATSLVASNANQPINQGQQLLIACFANANAFTDQRGTVHTRIKLYLDAYGILTKPSDTDVQLYFNQRTAWVNEAITLFNQMAPQQVIVQPWLQQYAGARAVGAVILLSLLVAAIYNFGI